MKKNIILDVDPGVDDAISMIYSFLTTKFDVRLICVTKGNKDLDQSTLNALFVTENFSKKQIPVVQGAKGPLKKKRIKKLNVHGKSGLGSKINVTQVNSQTINSQNYTASEAILDCVKKYKNIIYICNGPCSTLATALNKYPQINDYVESYLIMGGTIKGTGSITPYASFNMFSDPEAALRIIKTKKPITFSPSEIGLATYLDQPILDRWSTYGIYGQAVKDLYTGYHDLLLPTDKFATHDLCAVLSVAHPEFFEFEKVKVKLNTSDGKKRGQTIFKKKRKSNITLITKADREKIIKEFEKCLKRAK